MEKFIYICNRQYIFVLDSGVEWPAILVVDIYEKDGGFFNAFTVYNEEEGINFKDTVEALYDRMGGKAVNDLNRFCEFLIKMQKTPERMEELIAECNLDEAGEDAVGSLGRKNKEEE